MRTIVAVLVLMGGIAAAQQKSSPRAPVPPVPPPLPPSTEDLLFADLGAAKWVPSEKLGLPKGAEVAPIGADPVTTGVTAYLKAPVGWRLPAHWHTHAEYTALILGRVSLTVAGKKHALTPGAYTVLPGKTVHELTCEADPNAAVGGLPGCILLVRRSGPTDLHWVEATK